MLSSKRGCPRRTNVGLDRMSNAKFLAFDTPNTKNTASWGVLYVLKIWNMLQYASIFNTVRTEMLFTFIIILFVFPSDTD